MVCSAHDGSEEDTADMSHLPKSSVWVEYGPRPDGDRKDRIVSPRGHQEEVFCLLGSWPKHLSAASHQ